MVEVIGKVKLEYYSFMLNHFFETLFIQLMASEHCMIVLETSAFMTKHNHVHPHMIFHLGVLFMLEATYVTLIFRG